MFDNRFFNAAGMTEIGVVSVPDVAHGRVDVTNVKGLGMGDDSLGHAVGDADYQRVLSKIEGFDGGGEEGEKVFVPFPDKG